MNRALLLLSTVVSCVNTFYKKIRAAISALLLLCAFREITRNRHSDRITCYTSSYKWHIVTFITHVIMIASAQMTLSYRHEGLVVSIGSCANTLSLLCLSSYQQLLIISKLDVKC